MGGNRAERIREWEWVEGTSRHTSLSTAWRTWYNSDIWNLVVFHIFKKNIINIDQDVWETQTVKKIATNESNCARNE